MFPDYLVTTIAVETGMGKHMVDLTVDELIKFTKVGPFFLPLRTRLYHIECN